MPKVMSCTQLFVMPELYDKLDQFVSDVYLGIYSIPGYEGISLWRDRDIPERYLILTLFTDEAAADAAWEKLSNEEILDRGYNLLESAPDTRRFKIARSDGMQPDKAPPASLLSISARNASTGYGYDLMAELDGIFDSLHVIPGFKGMCFGPNAKLPEEIFGLVVWSDLRSFQASIPANVPYEIQLYEKLK